MQQRGQRAQTFYFTLFYFNLYFLYYRRHSNSTLKNIALLALVDYFFFLMQFEEGSYKVKK